MTQYLAAACVLLTALVQPAHAVIGIVIGDETGVPGETIAVPVNLSGSESFYDFVIAIEYDPAMITAVGHAPLDAVTDSWVGGTVDMTTEGPSGTLIFTGTSTVGDHATTYSGGLFEIEFEISDDAEVGDSSAIRVAETTFTSVYGGEAVTVSSDGSIRFIDADTGASDEEDERIVNGIHLPHIEAEPGQSMFMDIRLVNGDPLLAIDTHVLFDGSAMRIDHSRAPILSDRSDTLDGITSALTEDAEQVLLFDSAHIPEGDDTIIQVPITIPSDAVPGMYALHWGMVDAYAPGLWSIALEEGDGTLTVLHPDADSDGYRSDEDCDDTEADVHPGAEDHPGDGIDQDCDGLDAQTETPDQEDEAPTDSEEADPGEIEEKADGPNFQVTEQRRENMKDRGCSHSRNQDPSRLFSLWVGMLILLRRHRRS